MQDQTQVISFCQRSRAACVVAGACLLLVTGLSGCGSDLPTTIPVSGQITFDGGPCPKPGALIFAPIEMADGLPRRSGVAQFDTDGKFTATTFSTGSGLMPGRYALRIECWKRPPLGDGSRPISYVADSYVPPEVNVSVEEGAVTLNLDLPTNKSSVAGN